MKAISKAIWVLLGLTFVLAFLLRQQGGLWFLYGSATIALLGGVLICSALGYLFRKQTQQRWLFAVVAAGAGIFVARGLFHEMMAVHVLVVWPPNGYELILVLDHRVAVILNQSESKPSSLDPHGGALVGQRMTPGNVFGSLRYSVACESVGTIEAIVGTNTLLYTKARSLVLNGQTSDVSNFWGLLSLGSPFIQ